MALTQKNTGNGRIRGQNIAIFIKSENGVPMEEALRRADESGLVISSNKRLSKALVGSDEWRSIDEVFACWSGTMTAYDKPDQKLGKAIEYTDPETGTRYVFPVPQEHQGKKNIVLVAEHPDFTLEQDGNNRIVISQSVGIVNCFPTAETGWFLGDPKYDIPHGDGADSNNRDARYIWRIDKRVGLVARGINLYSGYGDRRYVDLCYAPSDAFGVAIESA